MLQKHVAVALLLIGLVLAWPATTLAALAHQAECSFKLGFKALHDLIPDVVGDCIGDEYWNDVGDSNQFTARGLLAWRKADNRMAFTNGTTTWINGPYGVVSRPNGGPLFPWESRSPTTPPAAQPAPQPSPAPAPAAPPAPTLVPAPTGSLDGTAISDRWQYTLVKSYRDRGLPDNSNKTLAETVRPKGVFIVVILTAKNLGNVPSAVPRFELVDSNGRIFSEDRYAGLYGSFKYGTQSISTQLIQPSLTSTVTVGFDVARDAEGLGLRMAPQ